MIKIIIGKKQVNLTAKEFEQVVRCIGTMVRWDTGGAYGDGEEITERANLNAAKRAVEKINRAL